MGPGGAAQSGKIQPWGQRGQGGGCATILCLMGLDFIFDLI